MRCLQSAVVRGANAATNAISYAKFYSRSHDAVIRIYDVAGNVIETHEHKGDFKDFVSLRDQIHRELMYRPLQFQKRSQLFIGAHNETLSLAMRDQKWLIF